jgi:hypothetical protein
MLSLQTINNKTNILDLQHYTNSLNIIIDCLDYYSYCNFIDSLPQDSRDTIIYMYIKYITRKNIYCMFFKEILKCDPIKTKEKFMYYYTKIYQLSLECDNLNIKYKINTLIIGHIYYIHLLKLNKITKSFRRIIDPFMNKIATNTNKFIIKDNTHDLDKYDLDKYDFECKKTFNIYGIDNINYKKMFKGLTW